jgi:hypothetical protein
MSPGGFATHCKSALMSCFGKKNNETREAPRVSCCKSGHQEWEPKSRNKLVGCVPGHKVNCFAKFIGDLRDVFNFCPRFQGTVLHDDRGRFV